MGSFQISKCMTVRSLGMSRGQSGIPVIRACVDWTVDCYSLSRVRLFATPRTVARLASLSMELSRQEYWSGLPFPLQRNFPTQGSDPGLLPRRQILYRLSHREVVIRACSGPHLLIATNPAESVLATSCGVLLLTAPTLHQAWPLALLRTHPPPVHGEHPHPTGSPPTPSATP